MSRRKKMTRCKNVTLCKITKMDGQRGGLSKTARMKGRWIIENRHPKLLSDSIQDQVKQMINEVARRRKTSF